MSYLRIINIPVVNSHLGDIELDEAQRRNLDRFMSDFNFQHGGLWHQKYLSPNKYERAFEYRNKLGCYWTMGNNEVPHFAIGRYKDVWLENNSEKPFMSKKSGDDFRFSIRLIKDKS